MAGWTDWIQQFLTAASLPNTPGNQSWLADWTNNATAHCTDNPIDLSRPVGNATDCTPLTKTRTAQDYKSHAQAASAFNLEMHSGNFPNLLAGFQAGDPFSIGKLPDVMVDLQRWGATAFVTYLENTFGITPGGGGIGGPPGSMLPRGHQGFNDFQQALAHTLPTALRRSKRLRGQALRRLSAPRNLR